MLVNNLWNVKAKNDEEYKVALKGRIHLYEIIGVLGVITVIITFLFGKYANGNDTDFLRGVYFGIGTALIVCSGLRIFATKRLLKDEKKLHESRLNVQDERTIMISQKALATSGIIVLVAAYIGMLVMGFFNLMMFWTFWSIAMGYLVIYILIRMYYNKKY